MGGVDLDGLGTGATDAAAQVELPWAGGEVGLLARGRDRVEGQGVVAIEETALSGCGSEIAEPVIGAGKGAARNMDDGAGE